MLKSHCTELRKFKSIKVIKSDLPIILIMFGISIKKHIYNRYITYPKNNIQVLFSFHEN